MPEPIRFALLCCHPVQWNAATECNVMLLPSEQSIIHVEGVRCRAVEARSNDARFELGRVRCGLPTTRKEVA
jgi:hypothetical protein